MSRVKTLCTFQRNLLPLSASAAAAIPLSAAAAAAAAMALFHSQEQVPVIENAHTASACRLRQLVAEAARLARPSLLVCLFAGPICSSEKAADWRQTVG